MSAPDFATTLQGLGTLSSAVGTYTSASSKQASLNGAASISDINAGLAERQAQQTILAGQRSVQSSRLRTAQLKGRQRASLAANGVDIGVGSALNILGTTDIMGELDAQTIEQNAIQSAWGYRMQATNYTNDANLKRAGASAINPSGEAFTSALTSARSVASSWYKLPGKASFEPDTSYETKYSRGMGR
jgi:hypothetical protein